jgi:hypothetical protein
MIYRFTTFFSLLCLSVLLIGCSTFFSVQEWSDNYALMDGAQSTSPQMIDGKLETIGETTFSGKTKRKLLHGGSEVVITLPGKKRIRRIVLHANNLKQFNIYADREGEKTAGSDWQLIKEVQSVKTDPIDLTVMIPFATDRIQIRVLKTTEDAQMAREKNQRLGGLTFVGTIGAPGKIRELELYGYKTSE